MGTLAKFSSGLALSTTWNRTSAVYYKKGLKHSISSEKTCHLYSWFKNVDSINNIRHKWNTQLKNCMSTSSLDVNTNVAKDVILFKYENPKFFRIINIFALSQFGFWAYLSHFAFTSLKDAPAPKNSDDIAWWRKVNLGENKYRNGLAALSFIVGEWYFIISVI